MDVLTFTKAKATIANACNSTALAPADLVGVLSAVLAEARERMAFELTGNIIELENRLAENSKEEEANEQ